MWYQNGQKMSEVYWKRGKKSAVSWKPNGVKCLLTNLKDGNGVLILYNEDGSKKLLETFRDGEKHGLEVLWLENGRKEREGNWKNGELDGTWTKYNDDGTEAYRTIYKDGLVLQHFRFTYQQSINPIRSESKPMVAQLTSQDVFGGKFHEVRVKLQKGADPDAILLPKGKRTALHCSCMGGRVNIVKLLLAKGANPNALDKYNMTPLDILFSPDFEGRAPLERMSAENQLEIQRMLEKAGGKRNRLPSKELFKGKYITDTAPKKDSASSKSVSAAEPNLLPEKLSPDAARQFLSEDIGRWKVNITERTKDNPPINYDYVMAVRWEKKGEVSRWEFSPMINGERVPIKGFKKYDVKEGVFIWRAQREGFPDMVERQIYDKSTNTLNTEVTYPNGAKGKTTWLKAGKDEWRGIHMIIFEGKVVVMIEFISKRIPEVTPNP